jgi:1-deoxy-D-xylulose-5-phosphate synthase
MTDGTGLAEFAARFKNRFFDVGIAEGHMVSFAAGLAAGGFRPVVAVYSTFLQRAVDHVMHDVAISSLPVVFCVDRAGVVGADGVTHPGVFDIAMLRTLPNLTICQPADEDDFAALLAEALERGGPTVIRYPRGGVSGRACPPPAGAAPLAVWATGDWFGRACEIAGRLGGEAVHARYLKPHDARKLARQRSEGKMIVSIENGAVAGGFGEAIGADIKFGWPDEFIPHGTQAELERSCGLDTDSVIEKIKKAMKEHG